MGWSLSGRPVSSPGRTGSGRARGFADAIAALFTTLMGKSKRVWIVDADLSAAFDRIDSRLLAALGSFPARDMIAGWPGGWGPVQSVPHAHAVSWPPRRAADDRRAGPNQESSVHLDSPGTSGKYISWFSTPQS
jgi:hypothetical protein